MAVDPEGARFRLGEARGHYESWFVRGNHPTRPLAFWFRYTVTSPAGHPEGATPELYAIVFDGERGKHHVARETHPLTESLFPTTGLGVRLGAAHLERDRGSGSAHRGDKTISWELAFEGGQDPLLLLPERMYAGSFPKAKSLVMRPNVAFKGHVTVDGERIAVDGWRGSLNHNWGERHTDRYAWAQVAGFPDAPDTFLEVATARIRLGPILSPAMTPLVLRHKGKEHRLNALHKVFGRARVSGLEWTFKARGDDVRVRGSVRATPMDVVTLVYPNPSGGSKICVNTKIATCELEVVTRDGTDLLRTGNGAAFELLVDTLADTGKTTLPTPV